MVKLSRRAKWLRSRKRISACRGKKHQYEITITGGRPNDYGMPTNPPIVVCAKNKTLAKSQFKFPKSVKIKKIRRV